MDNNVFIGRTEADLSMTKSGVLFTLRAAALIIKDNMFLAAKSNASDLYHTIGGGIKIHESSEEAVIREIYEETGHKLEIDRIAFIQERFMKVKEQQYHEIVFFYLMKTPNDLNISNNSATDHESETLHWLPLDNISEINLVPPFLKTKSFDNIISVEHIISDEVMPDDLHYIELAEQEYAQGETISHNDRNWK